VAVVSPDVVDDRVVVGPDVVGALVSVLLEAVSNVSFDAVAVEERVVEAVVVVAGKELNVVPVVVVTPVWIWSTAGCCASSLTS